MNQNVTEHEHTYVKGKTTWYCHDCPQEATPDMIKLFEEKDSIPLKSKWVKSF